MRHWPGRPGGSPPPSWAIETARERLAGANSPFVTALVKNLMVSGVELRKLFDLVRDDVMDATNKRQQPFTYGSLSGRQDFYFVAK